MEATETQLQEIKKIEESTKDLSEDYFEYRPEYKKYVLAIQVRYPKGESDINEIIASDKDAKLNELFKAGWAISDFFQEHRENQYVLIVEGQASKDDYTKNYQLSYERALSLMRFWVNDRKISFGNNCEILISGSGDGRLDTHSMREPVESDNQRFLIHILPKNIFESKNENE